MIPGSDSEHASLLKSFGFAVQGLRTALATERNIRIMFGGMALAIALGFVCRIDAAGWAVILLGSAMVLFAELINTSIETIVDLVSPEYHRLAGRAKDISAAAVWVLCMLVALAGIVVYVKALFG